MKPTDANAAQQPGRFTGILRHLARRPLLLAWLVALAALSIALQSEIPQPWSGLIYLVVTPAAVIPATRSFERAHQNREDPSNT
ncbi:hypothetical protein [Streptomyces sp. NPDC052107]|uniref:hypothetical protein n=1 Tax=Streptomyces sp. NPDC052107 TaxID=3155632 RepID=UPI00342FF8E1